MFNEKKSVVSADVERNIIASNTRINGNIESDGDFRIDGTVEGDLQTKARVVIGKNGPLNMGGGCLEY